MAIKKIDIYGGFTPSGVDTGGAGLLQESARIFSGIQQQAGEQLFREAEQTGIQEGLNVDVTNEQGELQSPELRSDYTIRGQAFNRAAKLAYGAASRRDARENINRIYNETEDPIEFETRANAYLEGATQNLPDEMRFEIANDIQNTISTARSKKDTEFYNKEMNRNLELVSQEVEAASDDLLTAYNAGDTEEGARLRAGLEETLGAAEAVGLITATQRGSILQQLDEEAEKEVYLGDMTRIVDSSLPLPDRINLANEAIEAAKKNDFEFLNPRQKDSLIASMAAKASGLSAELEKQKSLQKLEASRAVSNLKVAVNTGQGDIGDLVNQTESFFDRGMIGESERTSIITTLTKRQQEELEKERRMQMFADRLAGDDTVIVDQKLTDEAYNEYIGPQLAELDTLEANVAKATIIENTRVVPTAIKSEISNAIQSRNPDQIAVVSDLIDRVENVPGVNLGLTKNDEAFVSKVVTLSQTLQPEEAIEIATRVTDPKDQDRIEARQRIIKEEKLAEEYEEIVLDEIDGLNDISKDRATKEYKELFESYYLAGMDKEEAQEKAIARMGANWQESEVAGMTIKNPPEQFYSVAGDASYIREQLLNDVFSENIFGGDESDIEVYLQSDDQTAREASKGKPSYVVMIFSPQDGFYALPYRWTPDVEAQAKKVKEQKLMDYQEIRKKAANRNATLEDLSSIGQGL